MAVRAGGEATPRPRRPATGWRRRLRIRLRDHLLPRIGPPVVRCLARSWRVDVAEPERLARLVAGGTIFALWHGHMLLALTATRAQGVVVLVSPSMDGEVSMRLLRGFGFDAVRGSTSQGGGQALRRLLHGLGEGRSLVLTPDGPRGPRHSANEGTAYLAAASGRPVACVGLATDRAWRLRSWDRFTIPKPFARVSVVVDAPFAVPGADRASVERATAELRERLFAVGRAIAARLGVEAEG